MAGLGSHPGEQQRLGPLPAFVTGGPHNPMGARGMYLYSGNKDTLYRIHGTNQPEYIGQAISSGCIRMTNEDAIDLYSRVKIGTIVVVLAPHHETAPFSPHVAAGPDIEQPTNYAAGREQSTAPASPGAVCFFRPRRHQLYRLGISRQAATCTISGGTPRRAGMMLVPRPPDTIRWRSFSTTWP